MYQNQICDIANSLWFLLQSIFLISLQLYKINFILWYQKFIVLRCYKVNMWYHTKKRHFVISQHWLLISQYPVSLYHFDSLIPKNQFCDITNSISVIRKSFFISRNKIFFFFMWYKKSNLWYHNIELVISQNNFDFFFLILKNRICDTTNSIWDIRKQILWCNIFILQYWISDITK